MRKISLYAAILVLFGLLPVFGAKTDAQAKYIYTNNAKINAVAEKIIDRATTENMTQEEKLEACFVYMAKRFKHSSRAGRPVIRVTAKEIADTKKKAAELKAKGQLKYSSRFRKGYRYIQSFRGTCYGKSLSYGIIANHLGFTAIMQHGYNGYISDHFWNRIVVNGQKRYFDLSLANHSWKRSHSLGGIYKYYCKKKNSKAFRRFRAR